MRTALQSMFMRFLQRAGAGMPGMLSVVNQPKKEVAAESLLGLAAAVGVLARWAK